MVPIPARVLSPAPVAELVQALVQVLEEELVPALAQALAQALEEASVPAWGLGSTPARASLLSWRCVPQRPPVDPSETDPAADPVTAAENWSVGMLPLVVAQQQEMVLGQEMLRAGWLPSCLGDCVPALAVPVPPGCRGVGWPAPVRNSQPPVGGCPCRTARCGRATAPRRRASPAPQPERPHPPVGPPVAPAARWRGGELRRSRPRRKPAPHPDSAAGNRRPRSGSC